jgi:hypothetical protein
LPEVTAIKAGRVIRAGRVGKATRAGRVIKAGKVTSETLGPTVPMVFKVIRVGRVQRDLVVQVE